MNPFDIIKKKNPFDIISSAVKTVKGAVDNVANATNQIFYEQSTPSQEYLKRVTGLKSPAEKDRQLIADIRASQLPSNRLDIQGNPIATIGSQTGKTTSDILKTTTPQENQELSKKFALEFAPGFAGTAPAKTLMTGVANKVAKSIDVGVIFKLLKTEIPELADDVAQKFATIFKDLTNPVQVDEAINKIKFEIQKKSSIFQKAEPSVTPEISSVLKSTTEGQKRPIQQQILESRRIQAEKEALETAPLPEEFPIQAQEIRDVVTKMNLGERVSQYKDIGNTKKQLRDITRNTAQVFGPEDFKMIDQTVLEPFNQSKGANIDTLNRELGNLKTNIIERFGFSRGSKESAAIQQLGEGKITLPELVQKFGREKSGQIVEAEQWFRQSYDKHLDALNAVEQQIYPNSPYKWTPKRADYFRHYQELTSDFSRLQNILENPIHIDPMLSGISETTQPKSAWASFKQKRTGTKTTDDAIGGYLNYLPSWSKAVNIDPHIGKFRELADVLARGTTKSKNLNNYIYNLRMYANELAGKSAEWDRIVNESVPGGRTTLQAVDWLNKRVKANTILFNVASSIAQIYNIPQGLASAGIRNSSKGLAKTLGQNFTENTAMKKSNFLKERYFKGFQEFDKGMLNNTKKMGTWIVTVLDEVGTKFIWNGQYEKAIQEGAVNPIKYADDATKLLVAGRGIGEKPLLQNSKVFQIVAPFQLELTNLWWVMEDLAKSDKSIMKKFGQFATLFISLYLFNSTTEQMTGNRLALDPIQMTLDGIDILKNDPSAKGTVKTGGRVAGEVLSNVPFGQTLASMYPEYGTSVMGVIVPTRKQLFGREDPTRYGGGLLSTKALSDPLFKILPPFGGGQLKKTIQGVSAVNKGKSTNISGDWQYRINPTGENMVRASLFGKSGTPEAQAYYEKKLAPKKKASVGNPFDN